MPEGKVRVKLDHDGTILDVDEDDVEKVGRRLVEGRDQGQAGRPLRSRASRCYLFSALLPVLSPGQRSLL